MVHPDLEHDRHEELQRNEELQRKADTESVAPSRISISINIGEYSVPGGLVKVPILFPVHGQLGINYLYNRWTFCLHPFNRVGVSVGLDVGCGYGSEYDGTSRGNRVE